MGEARAIPYASGGEPFLSIVYMMSPVERLSVLCMGAAPVRQT